MNHIQVQIAVKYYHKVGQPFIYVISDSSYPIFCVKIWMIGFRFKSSK